MKVGLKSKIGLRKWCFYIVAVVVAVSKMTVFEVQFFFFFVF
jgi:hypothetical protein